MGDFFFFGLLGFNPYISHFCILMQASAEREMKESDRLFMSLTRAMEERRVEVNNEIKEKQKATERRAEELVDELQQEVTELQRRNAELEELRCSEDHLHILQVKDQLPTVNDGGGRRKPVLFTPYRCFFFVTEIALSHITPTHQRVDGDRCPP